MSARPPLATTEPFLPATAECGPLCRRLVLRAFSNMQLGHLRITLPEGPVVEFGSHADALARRLPLGLSSEVHIRIKRPAFFKKCLLAGDIGFAESYVDGDWETPDLASLIAWFVLNVEHAPTLSGSAKKTSHALFINALRFANRLGHLLRPNSRATARRNIAKHYDLSNDFFQLFLDPTMMYSSARWPAHAPELSLDSAQREKNAALCHSLRLTFSDHVLEIGSGWGGWSIQAATTYGCRVTTLTISQQQYDLATARIAEAGVAHLVDVQMCDYRDITGTFDKIVSIEMMEALGHAYLPAYCDVLAARLKPEGLLALQFITCPDERYAELRRGVDFIQKHIFPGSLLLSLNRVNQQLARAGGFMLHHIEDFGQDYARTLRLWHDTFHAKQDAVLALGFDERFLRKWSYYLAYCEAAFAMRNISVVQTLHTRPNNIAF
jgi:cyclopropane-fatty-acyl-phospholipid synthase